MGEEFETIKQGGITCPLSYTGGPQGLVDNLLTRAKPKADSTRIYSHPRSNSQGLLENLAEPGNAW